MIDTKSLKKFNSKLTKMKKEFVDEGIQIPGKLNNVLTTGGNDIRNTMIKSMRDTRRKHFTHTVKRGKKMHWPSAPGHPPAIDSGELLRSLMFDVKDGRLEVGSYGGGSYSKYLEKGTKNMIKRPFLEPAVKKHEKEITDEITKVLPEAIGRIFAK